MRVLLVAPEFPDSYWSGSEALPFVARRCASPPLGLITVAALLPPDWRCQLVDLAIEPLRDDDIRASDVVMLSGMLVQRESLHAILCRCRRLGVRTVVGGPYATALPEELGDADHIVVGEGERTIPILAADLAAGRAQRIYRETDKPSLLNAPVPRYDLLKVHAYHSMAIQFSRGCPFRCEFCDIIVMYGRRPRTKTAAQIVAELSAIAATGFCGSVFFVDDNFVGNKKAVRKVLTEIASWRNRTRAQLDFYTEASINIADDPALMDLMTAAGFNAVFIGIETPSADALAETKKYQNLKRDMTDQVHAIKQRGLEVWGGFILGFDADDEGIFDQMIEFIERAAIARAMVGILGALPNTPLRARLQREQRLRTFQPGHQFGLTNVMTKIPDGLMARGYRRVLETLYDPDNYFQRCLDGLSHWRPVKDPVLAPSWHKVVSGLRAIWAQGVTGTYRRAYWRFLFSAARRTPSKLGRAIEIAAAGHHFIVYTRTTVVPQLLEVEAELERRQGQPAISMTSADEVASSSLSQERVDPLFGRVT